MATCSKPYYKRAQSISPLSALAEGGYSLVELLIVAAMILVIAAASIPMLSGYMRGYGLVSDARAIAGQLALARMKSANGFTNSEVSFDLTNGTYQIKLCSGGAFVADPASPVVRLSKSLGSQDSFGYGSITKAAGTQTTIAQPLNNAIAFNSRGIPITNVQCAPYSGTPTPEYAVYLKDNSNPAKYCAVTVSPSSRITAWHWDSASSSWKEL
jgi:Tfp pilus assembly protein FimT